MIPTRENPDGEAGADPAARFAAHARTLPRGPGRVRVVPGPVARIIFASPTRKNALDAAMMLEFGQAPEALAGARVVVLAGEGDAFCAGGDLGAVATHLAQPGLGAGLAAYMGDAVARLRALDAVLVAAVRGPALGGGAELCAACDLCFAAPDARIGWVQARMGVTPGFGGGEALVRRVGAAAALRLMVEARPLSAEEARARGLVDELADDPVAAALSWAEAAAATPPEVLRGLVRVSRSAGGTTGAATEREVFASLWGGPAHRAALEARTAGRPR